MKKVLLTIVVILFIIYLYNRYYDKDKVILKDFMEPSEENNGFEKKPINSKYELAWTEEENSKMSKYYTSDIKNEKVDIGKFFNEKNEFVDITSYKSKDIIPERCFYNNGELKCEFNNRLQITPPRLIKNPDNNPVILSIGNDKNINTNKVSEELYSFNGENYNVWDYDEKNKNEGGYNCDSTPSIIDYKVNYTL